MVYQLMPKCVANIVVRPNIEPCSEQSGKVRKSIYRKYTCLYCENPNFSLNTLQNMTLQYSVQVRLYLCDNLAINQSSINRQTLMNIVSPLRSKKQILTEDEGVKKKWEKKRKKLTVLCSTIWSQVRWAICLRTITPSFSFSIK